MCSLVESDDESSDTDIWEYKSAKRKKETVQITASQEIGNTKSPIIAHPFGAISVTTSGTCQTQSQTQKRVFNNKTINRNTSVKQTELCKQQIRQTHNDDTDKKHQSFETCKTEAKLKLQDYNDIAVTSVSVSMVSASASAGNSSEIATNDYMTRENNCCEQEVSVCSSPTPCDRKHQSGSKLNVEGHCPMCQMPFCALTIDSPRTHVTECMDLPLINSQECGQGVDCDCTIPSHYRKFKHTELAALRSGICPSLSGTHQESPDVTSPYFKAHQLSNKSVLAPSSGTVHTIEEVAASEASSVLPTSGARRSLAESFQGGTVSRTNAPPVDECLLHPEVAASLMDRSRDSDSDIFNLDDDDAQQVDAASMHARCSEFSSEIGAESIEELAKDVSELIADAISDVNDEDVSSEVAVHKLRTQAGDSVDSDSDSVICTGGSSTKENSFNLTPLKPVLTPVSSTAGDSLSKSDFLKLLTPQSSQNTPSKKVLVSASQKLSSSQKTPSGKKSRPGETKNYGSAKKAKLTKNSTPGKKPKLSKLSDMKKQESRKSLTEGDSSKTQRTVSSFFQPLERKENPKPSGKSSTKVSEVHEAINTSAPSTGCKSENTRASISKTSSTKAQPRTIPPDNPTTSVHRPWALNNQDTSNPARVLTSKNTSNVDGEASCSDDVDMSDQFPLQSSATSAGYRNKPCPFYKKIPGTPFSVDAFQYGTIPGCKAYFLSHFHYDHYIGLKKNFQHLIYCSRITANLVQKRIRVSSEYLRPLAMNKCHIIEGVEVTLLEANHCPGSVLFLFKLRNNRVFLHTGDFRASPGMEEYPELKDLGVHQLYLDTTYCDPAHSFPSQSDVVRLAVDIATKFINENPNGIVVVGSYTIGKERIFQAIAEELDCRICVARDKLNILTCLEDASLDRQLTVKAEEARVHVLPMKSLNFRDLDSYVEKHRSYCNKVLAFEPTGWTHSKKTVSLQHIRPKVQQGRVTLYGIPYSEHSSYTEMKRFVQFLRPEKILPTVNNGSAQSRKKMETHFTEWMKEDTTKKPMKQSALNGWIQTPTK